MLAVSVVCHVYKKNHVAVPLTEETVNDQKKAKKKNRKRHNEKHIEMHTNKKGPWKRRRKKVREPDREQTKSITPVELEACT